MTPILTTDRLRLRGWQAADFPAFAALHASPHARFMWALTAEAAWDRFCALAGEWALFGRGMWVLDRDGAFVGHAGFYRAGPDAPPDLGWALVAGAEGQGLAAEAVRAIRAHAARAWAETRAESHIDARNARSIRLARRLGAVETARITHAPEAVETIWQHPEVRP
jgi:RimJ/RimL family protein N-acetyltransferase